MKRIFMLAVAILIADGAVSMAQGPRISRGRYQPSRPVISPYLYLSRGSVGGVPAYYAWVKPQFAAEQRQNEVDSRFDAIDRQLIREQAPGGNEPSSRGSTFMNYSHFYPSVSGNRAANSSQR